LRAARYWEFESAAPGVSWPALPAPGGATLLALLFCLERRELQPPFEQARRRPSL